MTEENLEPVKRPFFETGISIDHRISRGFRHVPDKPDPAPTSGGSFERETGDPHGLSVIGPCSVKRLVKLGNMDIQDAQDKQDERLLQSLRPNSCKLIIIIDLTGISRLQFPQYIPLFEKESTGPSKTLADVTVQPSRGVHPPRGGGLASRTDGSPVIAGTSNVVRVQASRPDRSVTVSRESTVSPRSWSEVATCACCESRTSGCYTV